MTNHTDDLDLIITRCEYHGETFTQDWQTFEHTVQCANRCATEPPHGDEHRANDESCWVCCPSMVIDPHGMLDY